VLPRDKSGHAALGGARTLNDFFARLHIYLQRDRGQTMAEYVVVLGIISVAILLALGALSGSISGQITRVSSDL
jgi:Flp pilus assembly pilin Flp